jgi:hypothetical protein
MVFILIYFLGFTYDPFPAKNQFLQLCIQLNNIVFCIEGKNPQGHT